MKFFRAKSKKLKGGVNPIALAELIKQTYENEDKALINRLKNIKRLLVDEETAKQMEELRDRVKTLERGRE